MQTQTGQVSPPYEAAFNCEVQSWPWIVACNETIISWFQGTRSLDAKRDLSTGFYEAMGQHLLNNRTFSNPILCSLKQVISFPPRFWNVT